MLPCARAGAGLEDPARKTKHDDDSDNSYLVGIDLGANSTPKVDFREGGLSIQPCKRGAAGEGCCQLSEETKAKLDADLT